MQASVVCVGYYFSQGSAWVTHHQTLNYIRMSDKQINKCYIILVVLVWLMVAAVMVALESCSTTTEEHISATADAITFDRVVGKRAVTGGFVLSKDSLKMQPTN